MPSVNRDFSLENPFLGSEKPSSCEGFISRISTLKRQIETQYCSQNESLIV
jgi:hypothetical protein